MIPLPTELRGKELTRLAKEQERLEQNCAKLRKQLANEAFVAKAPAELVAKQKQLLKQSEQELAEIRSKLETHSTA